MTDRIWVAVSADGTQTLVDGPQEGAVEYVVALTGPIPDAMERAAEDLDRQADQLLDDGEPMFAEIASHRARQVRGLVEQVKFSLQTIPSRRSSHDSSAT